MKICRLTLVSAAPLHSRTRRVQPVRRPHRELGAAHWRVDSVHLGCSGQPLPLPGHFPLSQKVKYFIHPSISTIIVVLTVHDVSLMATVSMTPLCVYYFSSTYLAPEILYCITRLVNYSCIIPVPVLVYMGQSGHHIHDNINGNTYTRTALPDSRHLIIDIPHRFTPSRFLILNLSFSDFLTGVYLMMLAVVDARTYGFYEDYAMAWQSGPGCKVREILQCSLCNSYCLCLTLIFFACTAFCLSGVYMSSYIARYLSIVLIPLKGKRKAPKHEICFGQYFEMC